MLENDQNDNRDNNDNQANSSELAKKKVPFGEAIKDEAFAKRLDFLAFVPLAELLIFVLLSDFIFVLIDNIENLYIGIIAWIAITLPFVMASFIWIAYRNSPKKLQKQTFFNRLFSKPILWMLFIAIILIASKTIVNYLFLEQFTAYIMR